MFYVNTVVQSSIFLHDFAPRVQRVETTPI
jgi:hypothetical protein